MERWLRLWPKKDWYASVGRPEAENEAIDHDLRIDRAVSIGVRRIG